MAKEFSEKLLAESVRALEEKKASLEDKIRQYTDLETSLLSTAQHSSKQVLIPLSSVGFIPGRLKHTNEIYVHLGSNYFVQRTAHECQGIIHRREAKLQESLAFVTQSINKHTSLQDLPVEVPTTHWNSEGFLEINEPFEEEVKNKPKPILKTSKAKLDYVDMT